VKSVWPDDVSESELVVLRKALSEVRLSQLTHPHAQADMLRDRLRPHRDRESKAVHAKKAWPEGDARVASLEHMNISFWINTSRAGRIGAKGLIFGSDRLILR